MHTDTNTTVVRVHSSPKVRNEEIATNIYKPPEGVTTFIQHGHEAPPSRGNSGTDSSSTASSSAWGRGTSIVGDLNSRLTSVEIALLGRDRLERDHSPVDSEAALLKESISRQAIIGRKIACVLGKRRFESIYSGVQHIGGLR